MTFPLVIPMLMGGNLLFQTTDNFEQFLGGQKNLDTQHGHTHIKRKK